MRVLRVLVFGFLALLVLIGGGGALLWWLGGTAAHQWVARQALEAAFDREVRLGGTVEVELGAEPSLFLTDLSIDSPSWATNPTLLSVAQARVQIALRPLLNGVLLFPRVALEGVDIHLETAADGRNNWQLDDRSAARSVASGSSDGGQVALPLFADLSLSDADLAYLDQRTGEHTDLRIKRLRGHGGASGQMKIDTDGDINGHAFRIQGEAGSLEMALSAAPYPIEMDFALPALTAKLKGTVTDVTGAQAAELHLNGESDSLRTAVEAWGVDLPIDATASVDTKLTGDLAALSLTDLTAEIKGPDGDRLHLTGSIGDAWRAAGLDATLTLSLESKGQVAQRMPEGWRLVDQLKASANATGSLAALVLEDLSVDIEGAGKSSLKATGKIQLAIADGFTLDSFDLTSEVAIPEPATFDQQAGFQLSVLGPLHGTATLALAERTISLKPLKVEAETFGALQIEARGRVGTLSPDNVVDLQPAISLTAKIADSAPLVALVDDKAAGLGPIDAAARLVRGEQGYRLDEINLALGTAEKLSLAAEGSIGPFKLDDPQATSLDLDVHFGWPTSRVLDPFLGQDLPDLGKAQGTLTLGGTVEDFHIDAAHLETERKDGVKVTVTGGVEKIMTRPPKIQGAAFDLDARAPSTTTAAQLFGYDAPDLGPVRARTKLEQSDGTIALSGLDVTSGPADTPSIKLTGTVGDLLALEKLNLDGAFALPTRTVLAWADIHGKAEIGRLHGKLRVSDAQGKVGLEHLEAELKETNLLSLTMQGEINDLAALDEVKFETSLEVPNVADLAEVFDADASKLERFKFDGTLSGDNRRFDAEGKATLGGTDFSGEIVGNFEGVRPSFKGSLISPRLQLADLGLRPEATGDGGAENKSRAQAQKQRLFGNEPIPIERLRDFDLDLFVEIDKIEGVEIDIDHASAQVVLVDGELNLSPLKFLFVGGQAELNAEVDAGAPTPEWSVRAEADDVDLGHLWAQLRTEVPVTGALDLMLDLQASGTSPRNLAASLDGEVSLAIQNGQLQTSLLGLTTMSPLRWLVATPTRRGYSVINCFVARLNADKGVANVSTLVLDTPNVIAKGKGTIDLGRETIDLKFKPEPKSGRIASLTTPFAITGNLADPSVEVSTTGTVARVIGEIALSPVNLLGSLLPFVDKGDKGANPCLDL